MSDLQAQNEERRTAPRVPAFFAVELNGESKRGRCGVVRNVAERGILIMTPSRFAPSERLELSLHVKGTAASVKARVVRVQENPMRSNELWRYRLAVELESPLPADIIELGASAFAQAS